MTTPGPKMQVLAEAAAEQIARKLVAWIQGDGGTGAQIGGPVYRQVESIAVPAILAVLEQQHYEDAAQSSAKDRA